jgi:hypothetical protein
MAYPHGIAEYHCDYCKASIGSYHSVTCPVRPVDPRPFLTKRRIAVYGAVFSVLVVVFVSFLMLSPLGFKANVWMLYGLLLIYGGIVVLVEVTIRGRS